MNQSPALSPRLNEVYALIVNLQHKQSYTHIWDCCCDHGYLGMKILNDDLCEKLIFVDQLSHIMELLATNLETFDADKYELITADAGELDFNSGYKHLALLAGVGGERIVEIISSIALHNPDAKIDYIFCPSTSQDALRKYLVDENFGMAFESIVCEKKRCYEVMYVQASDVANELPRVSLSCDIWEKDNPVHQQYLSKVNTHRDSKKKRRKSVNISSE